MEEVHACGRRLLVADFAAKRMSGAKRGERQA